MKITLYLQDKLIEFFLPIQVSGSYSFDANSEESAKLINIEARNGKWILYSTDSCQIIDNGNIGPINNNSNRMYSANMPSIINEIEIQSGRFYLISKNEINYLISVNEIEENEILAYSYEENSIIRIGNSSNCNFIYDCKFLNNLLVEIALSNNRIIIRNNKEMFLYLNKEIVVPSEVTANYGDTLDILGLKIVFLPKLLLINKPNDPIYINEQSTFLRKAEFSIEKYKNLDIKDDELYDKNDYFSKSPRIRRTIEEKELTLDPVEENKSQDTMPLFLTIGPMLSMGAMSGMTLLNTITQMNSGQVSLGDSIPRLVTSILMLGTSLFWPLITKAYNKHVERDANRKLYFKYLEYLKEKDQELKKEEILQKNIICENLINSIDCLKIINTRKNNFWCKTQEQNDFLEVRVGTGNVPLKVNINFPEEGFTIEQSELKKRATELVDKYKYIENVPVGFSLFKHYLTAIMGIEKKCYGLVNNILLQLMTFYCYDELKIAVLTNNYKSKKWDYIKYSNYCFTNDKKMRFFATNLDEARDISSYFLQEINYRIQVTPSDKNNDELETGKEIQKPYYLIICDDYPNYKKIEFLDNLLDLDNNIGFSTLIIENTLSKLPSKCVNFINLNEGSSGILENSYENAAITDFHDEIIYDINMMEVTKILSNIPIEIEGAAASLPEAISFLEMEKVGKVEQLNILNRWNTNDSTKSLRAEVGVDEEGDLMYLDLHEKFHGPHGLVAGTTGSGKSEFIITYILSMAMNYSPDDIAFILIDYKGGGLAFAFENKTTGIKLPHLAGTITNLDKSEMNRTLVSIDSEVKRRQAEFNKARDILGESTIDIYKYQRFYHEGKIQEPIPHLFIISDEFAELKSQQPEFMDNLISVARIGRSLGVHLILATQKPSGVVNDQIWSNSKFKVCLKVQDASDSNEMLKRPDAALLKQSGRFYLQVGMDEYFALGQSGWAGAKYFPSDEILKQIDKSINLISNDGSIIKSAQVSTNKSKAEAKGEQLAAIMNEIINVSKQTNKEVKRLWLENIPSEILVDDIEKKYNCQKENYNIEAIIGEYDAPELQRQGIVKYNLIKDGNTLIYGNDGEEKEMVLNAIIYSLCKKYSTEELNFYTIDYGSEALRMFASIPHCGGMVFMGENEKYTNLLKLIREEISKRKKLFVDYGGSYENYIRNSNEKLPLRLVIINGYDNLKDNIESVYDELPEIVRDSERYGIVFILTLNASNSASGKLAQNFKNNYALHLNDLTEYSATIGVKAKFMPQECLGRGILNNEGAHEFQTALLTEDHANQNQFISQFITQIKEKNKVKAKQIPVLPDHVLFENISEYITDITSVPIGISSDTLDPIMINMISNVGNVIASNKLKNTIGFAKSIITLLKSLKYGIVLIDSQKMLNDQQQSVSNYFDKDFDIVIEKIMEFIKTQTTTSNENNASIIIFGIDKILSSLSNKKKIEEMFDELKKFEKIPVILFEENSKIKNIMFETWYKNIFSIDEGLWIGTGVGDQSALKTTSFNKKYSLQYPNNMGFYITEGIGTLCKVLNFYPENDGEENEQ